MIARIVTTNGWFVVKTPYNQAIKNALKSIDGRQWKPALRAWVYPATPSSAFVLHTLFEQKGVNVQPDASFVSLLEQAIKLHRMNGMKPEALPTIPVQKTKPFAHQKQAFWMMAAVFGDAP